jgi:hypothetical protein
MHPYTGHLIENAQGGMEDMKRQYLGDSKDSFKWDYLDFLVVAIGYSRLNIVWMMTPDDTSTSGRTLPELFPARPEILRLCTLLRQSRAPALLSELPSRTGAHYEVIFHNANEFFTADNRSRYFSNIKIDANQVVFLDPDNGFEPERHVTEKHVCYSEIHHIIQTISPTSVVELFQNQRRKSFVDDFARIRQRLQSGYATAIYWRSMMLVGLAPTLGTIAQIRNINYEYAKHHPITVLA